MLQLLHYSNQSCSKQPCNYNELVTARECRAVWEIWVGLVLYFSYSTPLLLHYSNQSCSKPLRNFLLRLQWISGCLSWTHPCIHMHTEAGTLELNHIVYTYYQSIEHTLMASVYLSFLSDKQPEIHCMMLINGYFLCLHIQFQILLNTVNGDLSEWHITILSDTKHNGMHLIRSEYGTILHEVLSVSPIS
jgi:hypothetical protein